MIAVLVTVYIFIFFSQSCIHLWVTDHTCWTTIYFNGHQTIASYPEPFSLIPYNLLNPQKQIWLNQEILKSLNCPTKAKGVTTHMKALKYFLMVLFVLLLKRVHFLAKETWRCDHSNGSSRLVLSNGGVHTVAEQTSCFCKCNFNLDRETCQNAWDFFWELLHVKHNFGPNFSFPYKPL